MSAEPIQTSKRFSFESYDFQSRSVWPGRGQIVLAQFDEDSIIVYQAFNEAISNYAVAHQKFSGCPHYNETRMTWIKTNFLWMMFRCGWAKKSNQDHILAIWLKRSAFDKYLENGQVIITNKDLKHTEQKNLEKDISGKINIQWDPDHEPSGKSHIYRRAIQMGLKNICTFTNGQDILQIQDITPFVKEQSKKLLIKRSKSTIEEDLLLVAKERVYIPQSQKAIKTAKIDVPEE